METDLLIVGAGPAGLAHAFWRGMESGLDYTVVEADDLPGGWVRTHEIDGFLCERGPQGIRPNDVSDEFLAALGLTEQVIPADPSAKLRYLARDGRLHPLPSGPGTLLSTDIFSVFGKLSLFMEPLRGRGRDDEESLADFAKRRFGRQTVALAEAMASGVYGGDAHAIEMAAAFPAVLELEREHGSLLRGMMRRRKSATPRVRRPALCTFEGGMSTLVRTLQERLGDRLQLGKRVVSLSKDGASWVTKFGDGSSIRCGELVLAIPARLAARLLAPLDEDLGSELDRVPFASIASVYLGFPSVHAAERMRGFGFLLDRREASPVLGAIYCSSILPRSAPAGSFLVRIMLGGSLHPEVVDVDDTQLIAEAAQALLRYTGIETAPTFAHVIRARNAIPQYVRGHSTFVSRVRAAAARHKGLRLIGNSYEEVSVVGQLRRPESTR